MAQDATTADPITTGQPAPMPRTGKVKESMHAAIMQWFYLLLLHKTPTLGSVSPCGVEDGARFVAVMFSDMANCLQTKL